MKMEVVVSPPEEYVEVCIFCNRIFTSKTDLEKHKLSHRGSRTVIYTPYRCHLCNNYFLDKETLTKHESIHDVKSRLRQMLKANPATAQKHATAQKAATAEKPAIAQEDGTNVASSSDTGCNLLENSTTALNNPPAVLDKRVIVKEEPTDSTRYYTCGLCVSAFQNRRELYRHECSKKLRKENKGQNKKLMRVACLFCDKTFCDKWTLNKHLRLHTGRKPYGCDQCEEMFSRADNLQRHLQKHADGKRYTCEHCGESFLEKSSLKKHVLHLHTRDSSPTQDNE